MRNRWIRPTIVAAILFVVVVLIVIGCSMKHRAPAELSAKPAAKSTQQATAHKVQTERKRASAHDSVKPCAIAASVTQHGNVALSDDRMSDPAHVLSQDNDAPAQSPLAAPGVIRILIAVETADTEKQPDPAFRLLQPPAQAGRRPPNSGWQHFRPGE